MLKNLSLALLFFVQVSLFADMSLGEKLEREMWNNVRDAKWDIVEQKIASDFQSIHFDGIRDNKQELIFLKMLKPSEFTYSNFQATESQDMIILTYDAFAKETIEFNLIVGKATRMSVWQNNNGTWQWIAHASLAFVNNP